MSLDVYLKCPCCKTQLFSKDITHNLVAMAEAAKIYEPLWRPKEIHVQTANELIPFLERGIKYLIEHETELTTYNPVNGWGNYLVLLDFCKEYLKACQEDPDAIIEVTR
jgi:hypothetical protein